MDRLVFNKAKFWSYESEYRIIASEAGNADPILNENRKHTSLLQTIAQQATLLGQTLPLGNFDRLEIRQPDRRSVALFGANRMVFITVAKPPHAQ